MEDFIHWCICAIGFLGGYRKSPNFMGKAALLLRFANRPYTVPLKAAVHPLGRRWSCRKRHAALVDSGSVLASGPQNCSTSTFITANACGLAMA